MSAEVAARGVEAPTTTLPHLHAIQASFGPEHDVSGISAHVGGVAAEACAQMNASAYAVGNRAAFATEPDLHTAAHEAAHVLQQRHGVHLYGGEGEAERHADAVADRVIRGESARDLLGASSSARPSLALVQRKAIPEGDGADHVGASPDADAQSLENPSRDAVAPGEAGYSRLMLRATPKAAEAQLGNYQGAHVRTVSCDFRHLRKQIHRRAVEVQQIEWEKSKNAGGTPSTMKFWTDAVTFAKAHGKRLEEDLELERQKMAQFNVWVGFANTFFMSLARLEAMQQMLGVKDPKSMVAALSKGLDDAKVVGRKMQSDRDRPEKRDVEELAVPRARGSIKLATARVNQAAQNLGAAHAAFRINALEAEIERLDELGKKDRNKLAEYEQVKGFLVSVGSAVDTGMGAFATSQMKIANAGTAMQRHDRDAARRASSRGPDVADDDWNVDHGPAKVEGDEDLMQGTGGAMRDVSVGGVAGTAFDLAFGGDIRQIKVRLATLDTQIDNKKAVQVSTEFRARKLAFESALTEFALANEELQAAMSDRRQDHHEFGVQLDRQAYAHDKKLAPKAGHERYATIFTLVAQIREILSIGSAAVGGFDSLEEFQAWVADVVEHRKGVGTPGVPNKMVSPTEVTIEEWELFSEIASSIDTYKFNIDGMTTTFMEVDSKASDLMAGLASEGGNKTSNEGAY